MEIERRNVNSSIRLRTKKNFFFIIELSQDTDQKNKKRFHIISCISYFLEILDH